MQQIIRRGTPRDHATIERRRQLRRGIAGIAGVLVILCVSGLLYSLPLGKQTYHAQLSEAGSIKVGDDVRIAGIPVGKVTSLSLRQRWVDMSFTVAHTAHLGNQTSLDIRMLTVVGGHYLAVMPAGSTPLGSTPIPTSRITLPYSLIQTVQDAEVPIRAVNGDTLRSNLAALNTSLSTNPDGLRRVGTAMNSMVDILQRQRDDVSRALAVADEYLATIDSSKALVGQLLNKISQLEDLVIDKKAEIIEAVTVTGRVIARLANLDSAWNTVKPLAQQLAAALPPLEQLGQRLGALIESVHAMGQRLLANISPEGRFAIDQSASTTSPQVCVPVPGRAC